MKNICSKRQACHSLQYLFFILSLCVLSTVPGQAQKSEAEFNDLVYGFFDYDKANSLNLSISTSEETPKYLKQKIVFDGIKNSRVPGYIATPKESGGPFPCVLLLHSGIGSKDVWWAENSFEKGKLLVDQLIATGYAVLMLDAQYDGERSHENDYQPSIALLGSQRNHAYKEQMRQTTIEYRIAMDYLASRGDIDMKRIGAFGTSVGANIILMLTTVDTRLKAVVVCSTIMQHPTFKTTRSAFDPIYCTPSNEEASILIQVGKKDDFSPAEKVDQVYKRLQNDSNKLIFYEFGHSPSEAYIPDAIAWFEKYL